MSNYNNNNKTYFYIKRLEYISDFINKCVEEVKMELKNDNSYEDEFLDLEKEVYRVVNDLEWWNYF